MSWNCYDNVIIWRYAVQMRALHSPKLVDHGFLSCQATDKKSAFATFKTPDVSLDALAVRAEESNQLILVFARTSQANKVFSCVFHEPPVWFKVLLTVFLFRTKFSCLLGISIFPLEAFFPYSNFWATQVSRSLNMSGGPWEKFRFQFLFQTIKSHSFNFNQNPSPVFFLSLFGFDFFQILKST